MGISVEWLKHLSKEDQKNFEDAVRGSGLVLGRLADILKEKEASLVRTEANPETYDAGYPYRQAFMNGRRAGLLDALRLLEFLDQKNGK